MSKSDELPIATDRLVLKYWQQPDQTQITIDSVHAVMSRETFGLLKEYSCSVPTDPKIGMMWKCILPYVDNGEPKTNWLRFVGPAQKEGFITIHSREVLFL